MPQHNCTNSSCCSIILRTVENEKTVGEGFNIHMLLSLKGVWKYDYMNVKIPMIKAGL